MGDLDRGQIQAWASTRGLPIHAGCKQDILALLDALDAETRRADEAEAMLRSAANCCARSPLCMPRVYAEGAQ